MGEVGKALGYQIADHAFALPAAFHGQQAGAQEHLALGFADVFPDDELGDAVLVFQRDEQRAFGRGGLLAQRHDAGGAHNPAVGDAAQLLAGLELVFVESRAQQLHGVGAQCEAGGGVVPEHFFAFGGFGEVELGFVDLRFFEQLRGGVQGGGVPDLLAAVAGEGGQRPGGGEGLHFGLVQAAAQGEFLGVVEGGLLAFFFYGSGAAAAQAGDQAQAQAHGWLVVYVFQCAVGVAEHYVDGSYLHAVAARVLRELAGGVKAHGLAVEQGGEKGRGFVALDPARGVDQQRKAGRMAFGEAVFREAFDLFEDLLGKCGRVAARGHAADDFFVVFFQAALALPGGHGAAQAVGFTGGEARGQHRHLHHLFLEHGHAQGAAQRGLEVIAGVGDGFQPLAPA